MIIGNQHFTDEELRSAIRRVTFDCVDAVKTWVLDEDEREGLVFWLTDTEGVFGGSLANSTLRYETMAEILGDPALPELNMKISVVAGDPHATDEVGHGFSITNGHLTTF